MGVLYSTREELTVNKNDPNDRHLLFNFLRENEHNRDLVVFGQSLICTLLTGCIYNETNLDYHQKTEIHDRVYRNRTDINGVTILPDANGVFEGAVEFVDLPFNIKLNYLILVLNMMDWDINKTYVYQCKLRDHDVLDRTKYKCMGKYLCADTPIVRFYTDYDYHNRSLHTNDFLTIRGINEANNLMYYITPHDLDIEDVPSVNICLISKEELDRLLALEERVGKILSKTSLKKDVNNVFTLEKCGILGTKKKLNYSLYSEEEQEALREKEESDELDFESTNKSIPITESTEEEMEEDLDF